MKTPFEHPTYQKCRAIFMVICIGIIIAELCGYIPNDVFRGRILNLVSAIMLIPSIIEGSYNWFREKQQRRQENA